MGGAATKMRIGRKVLLSVTALATFAAMPAPAFAGGRHHYQPRHYSYGHYNYGHYNYGHYRHRGHISAGEGALIAAGIIGGVILIDRALDNRDRYDRYGDRYYDRRYDNRRYDDRDRLSSDDNYHYRRDDRDDDGRYVDDRSYNDRYSAAGSDSDIDEALLGDDARAGSRPAVLADAAFRECVAETRGAAGAGGMTVAMPGAPTEVERLADGSIRMTAQFRAAGQRGESWNRRFVCEADGEGVRFLQVD
jgi:hypothetical protein